MPTAAPRFSKMSTWATPSSACSAAVRSRHVRDHRGHLVVVEVGHRLRGVVVVADDLGRADGASGPVQVVAGRRLRRVRREHREVVGEHEHAPVVGVRGGDAPAERRQRVVVRHRRPRRRDHLADPRPGAPMRGEQHPLAAERVPAQLPGQRGRSISAARWRRLRLAAVGGRRDGDRARRRSGGRRRGRGRRRSCTSTPVKRSSVRGLRAAQALEHARVRRPRP